jgi:hypothetical protein
LFVISAKAQGCSAKFLRRQSEKNRRPDFVLAGLDPAIHALGRSKQRRGYAGQARARRSEKENFPGQPCAKAGIQRRTD